MNRYRAYPEYKKSGGEWLDQIPTHWNLKKLKYLAFVLPSNVDKKSKDGEISIKLCNYTDVYYNERITSNIDFMNATASVDQISKFSLKAGDTLITKDSENPNDIAIPAYVPAALDGIICGYHLAIVRPRNFKNGAYLKRMFESTYVKAYFSTRSNGLTRYGLGTYALENIYYPNPPYEEAESIANFLDHETAKIDNLIEKQQQLIKLLKEKRQAVISHAVTKGLNSKVPMRDSGVEWLGKIPTHWKIKKLKFLCDLQTGDKNTEDAVLDGKYPFFVRSQTVERLNTYTADCEAVLTAGDGAGVGKVFHYINGKFDFHQRVYMMNNFRLISGTFFFHYLENMFHKIAQDGGAKSTVDSLRMPIFLNFQFTLPPAEEQLSIISFIESHNNLFKKLMTKASQTVELLQERRTALISAAVTGKIDVRNWQPSKTLIEQEAIA